MTTYRYDGNVRVPQGNAIPGASIAVCTQPANFSTQPATPLATIYAASTSNSATLTGAVWNGGTIAFTFSTTPSSDVVAGSYIAVSGVTPSAYNTTLSAPYLVLEILGEVVTVVSLTNPGTYVSGGTVATSVLPNPTFTDGNGNYFFYAAGGQLYSIQIYGPTITEIDLKDQALNQLGGGSVTSVSMTGDGVIFNSTVSGSPITSSGTLAPALLTQTANYILAGPTSGAAATPTFRALVAGDLPGGTGVTSVGLTLTMPGIFSVSTTGSPVTSSGTIAPTVTLATETANYVWAGPTSGSAAGPTFRAIVGADIATAVENTVFTFIEAGTFYGEWQDNFTLLTGSSDALTVLGTYAVNTSGVDAMTLGISGFGRGSRLLVVDFSGHDHTITAGSNQIAPSHHLVTFNGTVGSYVELILLNNGSNSYWFPLNNSGVTIS